MDEDVLVQELVDRLTFEVETLTGDKVVKFPNTNGTPLNVKVRVRNKDEPKLIRRGVISVPRPGNQLTAVPTIQLVGSDQTILSFNVFMEASSSKESTLKRRKQGFHFFKLGGCLGTSYDKDVDGPYLPSTSNKDALRSRAGSKSDSLILDDVHVLEDLPETHKLNTTSRNQTGLFGKCKPGGCLDPPFGEDKYPYTIPKIQPQLIGRPEEVDDQKDNINIINSGMKPKQTTEDAKKISNAAEKVNSNDTETKPLLNIFARTGEEHSLESNYSNSIITYPPDLTSSKIENNYQSTEKKTKNWSFESGSPRHSFEYAETYFVPPKDILRYKEEERRYSRELSNHKIKTKPSGTVDKHDTKKSKKGTEKLQQDTDNSQYKEKAHQELTKQADLNISDNSYLPNKSILQCGESEDDIEGSSKLDAENIKNTDKVVAPAFSTGSAYSYDDGDLKKKLMNKIQKQGSSTAASNIENNVYIQEMSDVYQAHIKSSGSPTSTKNSNTNVSNKKLITPISLSEPTDTDNIFDKDKYPYTIPKIQPQVIGRPKEVDDQKHNINIINSGMKSKQTTEDAKKISNAAEKVNSNDTETKPLLNIFAHTGEEHSLESNYSNSIITYPPDLTSSKIENNYQSTEKKTKNRSFESGSPRHSFEYAETYFVPPKDILRYQEEERRYSRELSNHKIKTKPSGTVDKHDAKKSKKGTEKLKQDTDNSQYKEKAHQELTKQSDLNISDKSYLPNKSILRCGESEDNIEGSSKLDAENIKNTDKVVVPAFSTGSAYSYDDGDLKKKLMNKIQKQGSSTAASNIENNVYIQEMSDVYQAHVKSSGSPTSTKNSNTNVSNKKLITPISLSEPTDTDNIFDKDKYPYTIPKIQPQVIGRPEEVDDQKDNINIINSGMKPKQTTKDAKNISNATEKVNSNDTETKPLFNIFARTGEEHSLESNYSNSIITYPPDLTSSKTKNNYQSTEKKTKNRSFESGSPRYNIQEISDVHQAHEKLSGSPNSTKNSNTNVSNPKKITPISLSEPTDTDNIIDKENIQKSTTVELVNLHDTYPEKDVHKCGENEDDINGASESSDSVNEKKTNTSLLSNEPTPDYFTDTVNKVNYGDPKNVPDKIENQTAFARDAFKENDLDTDEISNSRSSKKANEFPNSEPINSALFSNSIDADNVLSKENNTQIQATSQSNFPNHLLAELNIPHDIYPSKSILKSRENSNDDTDEASSSLKEITSPTDQALNTTDTYQVLYKIEKIDIDRRLNYPVSRDSMLSENKEFATSSIDTINSTEKTSTQSNTKTKHEVLESQAENLLKLAVPPNVENVIIQSDLSKQERSSVIFQKTPYITSNEASMYYEDISKINPIRRNTFPTVESRTSLQKHIEEISTQRNSKIGFDPQLKIGDESVMVNSKGTEYLNTGMRITNSNSAINLPQDTKETDSVLLASPSDEKEGNVNEFYINRNADTIPSELVSQKQNIEDTFDKTDSGKPISETSLNSNSTKEAIYLAPDTQSSNARYHAINNYVYAEYRSQLSTISMGKIDIQPDYLEVYKESEVTNKSITSTQSITRSPDDFRGKVKVEASLAVLDDNQFKFNSITQKDNWNQKVQNDNLISDKSIFHPRATERPETILLNLSFQSYINDNNERIVQTLNPLVKPQTRYIGDTVTAIQSLMRRGNEIRIPVDPENDLILIFFNKNLKPDEVNKVNTLKRKIMKQPIQSEAGEENRPATFPEDMLKKNLAIIYEKELIPLHDVIKDLTKEINGLLAQQELLKTKLRDAKRSRSLRLIPVNNRCGCRRN